MPANEKPIDVAVAPEVSDALNFQFLLIRPLLLGQVPIKASDLVMDAKLKKEILEYSVPVKAKCPPDKTADEQRKPLRGSHVFAAGQTEWVTDMLNEGHPGGLTKLQFWNNKPAANFDLLTDAEKAKLFKEDKNFQDATGKPLTGEPLTKAKSDWAKGRHDITVQIITGYTPVL